jgi:hypothetical protein
MIKFTRLQISPFQFDTHAKEFINSIEQFLFELREGRPIGPYAHQERILPATRTQPAWADVEIAWDNADHDLRSLLEILSQLVHVCSEIYDSLPDEGDELYGSVSNLYRRLSEIHNHINGMVFEPNPDTIYWVEIDTNQSQSLSLCSTTSHWTSYATIPLA